MGLDAFHVTGFVETLEEGKGGETLIFAGIFPRLCG
jgi:hypothetical protein